LNVRFPIEVDGQPREAELRFGTDRDARSLTRWRFRKNPAVSGPIQDALEFARLAAKRWRYYRRASATVSSLDELRESIRHDPKSETAMTFVAHATWTSPTPILGFTYFRRSWCHHLIVDFLSSHPRVISENPERIRGVGTGLVHQLVGLAEIMNIPCIWGEATSHSAPFYKRTLRVEEILDHFFIEEDVLQRCRNQLHKYEEQMLAVRTSKQ
jgi:hypothetical protein